MNAFNPYCLKLIRNDGSEKPYGFHLGTDKDLARKIAREKLEIEGVVATVLTRDGEQPERFTKAAPPAGNHSGTVGQCLETLPEPIRRAALAHAVRAGTHEIIHTDVANALDTAFNWNDTPEGFNFWEAVYQAVRDGKELPKYPAAAPWSGRPSVKIREYPTAAPLPDTGTGPFNCDPEKIDYQAIAAEISEYVNYFSDDERARFQAELVRLFELIHESGINY
jgi:hypothetical protein